MSGVLSSCYISSWDDAYSIGHSKIDSEHKKLFEIANEVYKCDESYESVTKIIKELIKYTKFHFKNEENFMTSVNFSGLNHHKKLHASIVTQLNDIIKNLDTHTLRFVLEELSIFVNKYILQHILIEDKKVHHSIKTREELKEKFKWKVEYKLKNELLDEEHQKLFEIAIEALNYHNTDIKTHVKLTIQELYEYMKTHFEHEEEYMQEKGYPAIMEHKEFHKEIIEQMNKFIQTLPQLKIVEFEKKLIEYMDIWLINHIIYEDRKIVNFVNESTI